ncbi:hypothetical protein [uncultured Winogradskyella sp.]|uniref:hypothetical protein n=1 Tax=uncultured Winogradskyella sp. TaxID=395353 RepID=UPI0030D783F2|tara:strand:+ start:218395 stop:219729 length:1335 start_codon:yes stop_codon:yes gene_type:complete
MPIYRNYFFLFISCLLLTCTKDDTTTTHPNVTADFIKTYGGSKNDSGQSVISTTDNGYAILGFTQSTDHDIIDAQNESFNYWVLKFNADDTMAWNKTYGGSGDDKGKTIIQTQDGGYAILGTSISSDGDVSGNAGMQDYWLAKLDATGNIQWQKSFGYEGADSGISVIQTNDLGYLISGVLDVTASGGEGNTSRTENRHAGGDYWVLKLNASGNIEWSKFFGGNLTDTPEGIIQTSDNGYIIAGGSDSADTNISNNIGSYDFWVIRISASGDLIWETSFGGDEIDEARAIVDSGDGNFIIAGDTRSHNNDVSNNNGAADLWVIKISPEGQLIWEKTIGGTSFDVARAITKTQDNNFLLAGSSRSSNGNVSENKGQNDAWALKISNEGHLLWETTFGGSNIDFGYGIAELNDNSIIVVGDTSSADGDITEPKGFTDLLLIKLNEI